MALREPIRKQCVVPAPGFSANPWGFNAAHVITISNSEFQLTKVNEIVLNMVFQFVGTPTPTNVNITCPGTAFFATLGAQLIMFSQDDAGRVVGQQSQAG